MASVMAEGRSFPPYTKAYLRHGSCLALFDDFPPLWRGVELPYRRGVFPRRGVSYFECSRLCKILEIQF